MSHLPRHGEARGCDRWDGPSKAWVRADEWQRRQWEREDRAFVRRANQGDLCAPMIIPDNCGGLNGVQSQVDGRHYDSKSSLRRHYRESGVVEVGNEPIRGRFWGGKPPAKDPRERERRLSAIGRAFAAHDIPTT